MGKGDKKSKKGKISSGPYGITRKRKKKPAFVAKVKKATPKEEEAPAKEETVKKAPAKKAPAKKKPAAKK